MRIAIVCFALFGVVSCGDDEIDSLEVGPYSVMASQKSSTCAVIMPPVPTGTWFVVDMTDTMQSIKGPNGTKADCAKGETMSCYGTLVWTSASSTCELQSKEAATIEPRTGAFRGTWNREYMTGDCNAACSEVWEIQGVTEDGGR